MLRFARRHAFQAGLALVAGAVGQAKAAGSLLPEGANDLRALGERLARAPRRRDFKTVPMILDHPDQWDDVALREVLAYRPATKQVWDNTAIEGPWLNVMRNALNTQVWSFCHPDFLVVSATHGSANLALYDQATWERYGLAKLAGDRFKANTLAAEAPAGAADPSNYQDPRGAFSPADSSIPALMRRGVVFMSCHNAIWEQAGKLVETGADPDGLGQDGVAADLTNHLVPGVVLIPGAVGTLPELQQAGFHYAR